MKTGVCEMLKNTTGEEEKKIPSEQESNLTHFLFSFFLDFRKRQKQKLKKIHDTKVDESSSDFTVLFS